MEAVTFADTVKGKYTKMKFYFSITGHGKSPSEIEFVELLQNLMNEFNSKHSVLDNYQVLAREDLIPE